jgi:hypothetical protein
MQYLFEATRVRMLGVLLRIVLLAATLAAISTLFYILALFLAPRPSAVDSPVMEAIGNTILALMPMPLYISLLWLSWCGIIENKKEVRALQYEPSADVNDLPATRVLVRGSAEPDHVQRNLLLRSAGMETEQTELLRAQETYPDDRENGSR